MKTYLNRLALLPHRCDECDYYFWLEPYRTDKVDIKLVPFSSYNRNLCKKCAKERYEKQ